MALIAKEGNSFEPVPEGVFPARCIWVVDIGTQTSDGLYGHKEKHQMYVRWEMIGELDTEGNPLTIGSFLTVSLAKKSNLRAMLESWRGRAFTTEELEGFDVTKLINAPCLVSVKHQPKADGSGGIRAQVSGVMAPMRGQVIAPAKAPSILLDLDAPDAKQTVEALPEWLQNKITITPEWGRIAGVDTAPPHVNTVNNTYAAARAGVPMSVPPPVAQPGRDFAEKLQPPARPAAPPARQPVAQPEPAGDFSDGIPF